MSYLNNNKIFIQQIWWLTMFFGSILTFGIGCFFPNYFSVFPTIVLFFGYFFYFIFILGVLPTYIIFHKVAEILYKKSISDSILRIELLFWGLLIFTINLLLLNWLTFSLNDQKSFISFFTCFYIFLTCFILTFKIERKMEFVKTNSNDDILVDNLDFE